MAENYNDYVFKFSVKDSSGTTKTVGIKAEKLNENLYEATVTAESTKLITSGAVKTYVDTEIGKINKLELLIVDILPTAGPDTMGKIYLTPKDTTKKSEKNVKVENITVKDGEIYYWEIIGDTEVSLEDYYTKNEVNDLLNKKVDKDGTKGLSSNDYTNEDKTKLAGISEGANKVEASNINGKIKIDGEEVTVYTAPEEKYAFDSIKVGDKKASAAEGKTTLAITAGTGISITTTTEKESGGPAIEISATGTEAQSATVDTAGIVKLPTFTEGCIDLTRV